MSKKYRSAHTAPHTHTQRHRVDEGFPTANLNVCAKTPHTQTDGQTCTRIQKCVGALVRVEQTNEALMALIVSLHSHLHTLVYFPEKDAHTHTSLGTVIITLDVSYLCMWCLVHYVHISVVIYCKCGSVIE